MELTEEIRAALKCLNDKEEAAGNFYSHAVIYPENILQGWDAQFFRNYTKAQEFTAENAVEGLDCLIVPLLKL